MIDKGTIEQAYSFFHQKLRVYEFSHSEVQMDDIEYAISSYVDMMSPELYDSLAKGRKGFLREHSSFLSDIREAVEAMDSMIVSAP